MSDTIDIPFRYTVDNDHVPGSANSKAWRAWAETLRPTTEAVLDHLDPDWRSRFQGDELTAYEFYPLEVTDNAEEELWRLNRIDALQARDFWRAVNAALTEAAFKKAQKEFV